jgi:hypothetical protein
MNFVTFNTFETRSSLLTSDYLVGYKEAGPTEIKTQIQDILDIASETFVQSSNTTVPAASTINNIVNISQANYDAIVTKDPKTVYIII